ESLTLAFGHGGQYADTQLLGVGGAATSEQAGARTSCLPHQLGQLRQVAEQAADKRISVRVGIQVQAGRANEILKQAELPGDDARIGLETLCRRQAARLYPGS